MYYSLSSGGRPQWWLLVYQYIGWFHIGILVCGVDFSCYHSSGFLLFTLLVQWMDFVRLLKSDVCDRLLDILAWNARLLTFGLSIYHDALLSVMFP